MGIIFISHSSKDNHIAMEIKARLAEQSHHSIFLDFDYGTGIAAGQNWERTLYRKLKACRAVISVCTDHYLSSSWCFAEIALARMERKPIFALKFDPLSPATNLPSILTENQYIDFRSNKEEAYKRLWRGFESAKIEAVASSDNWSPNSSPYPGLASFQEKDAVVFFGREDEINKSLDMLNSAARQDWVLVLGTSGVGKSSLLRAGIIPRLRLQSGQWNIVGPFRPRQNQPLEDLAIEIAKTFRLEWEAIYNDLTKNYNLAKTVRNYQQKSEHSEATTLIVIDQFEELLTYSSDHPAHHFIEYLRSVVEAGNGSIAIVATMRSDLLGSFQQHQALLGVEFDGLFLGPISSQGIRRIIEEPARIAEIEIDADLINALVNDANSENSLPLLAFTLRRLYEEYSDDGRLTLTEYLDHLQGLNGAVKKTVEDIIATTPLSKQDEKDLQRTFLKMVRLREIDQSPTRQPLKWINVPENLHLLFRRFEEARLLVFRGANNEQTVEISHEVLFKAWDKLRDWISENRAVLRIQQQLSRAAMLWSESNSKDDLWQKSRFDTVKNLQADGLILPNETELLFLKASRKAQIAAQLRRLSYPIAALLIIFAVFGAQQYYEQQSKIPRSGVSTDHLDESNVIGKRTKDRMLTLRQNLQATLPDRKKPGSVLIATWNIRDFDSGRFGGPRYEESINYIAEILSHFDLVAIQEIGDDLKPARKLQSLLGESWKLLYSDVTEGTRGNRERLGFLFDTRKISSGDLTGEIVLPPKPGESVEQPARTPFLTGFDYQGFRFTVCTVHTYWGTDQRGENDKGAIELRGIAEQLANKAERGDWSSNIVLLGDFGAISENDYRIKVVEDSGFYFPSPLRAVPTNSNVLRPYDQIAFLFDKNERQVSVGKTGVFNYYQYVFTDEDLPVYQDIIRNEYQRRNRKLPEDYKSEDLEDFSEEEMPVNSKWESLYKNWRTFQMSDHLIKWAELTVESKNY